MSLGTQDVRKPIVKIDVTAGSKHLNSQLLESTLIKFQYVSRQGRGQVPKIMMEFDNSSGLVFNPLILAVGLSLRVQFGYDGRMSKVITAPVKRVKANCIVDPATRGPASSRPDAYGTVVMEMHLHKHLAHVRPDKNNLVAPAGPVRISDMAKQLAKWAGYPDDKVFIERGLPGGSSKGNDPKASEPLEHFQVLEGESMMQALRRQAVQRGFWFSATEDEFHFHSPDWKMKPSEFFSYAAGPDVLSFSVDGDYTLNTRSVTGKGVNPLTGAFSTLVVDLDTTGRPLSGFYVKNLPIKGSSKDSSTSTDKINPRDFVADVSPRLAQTAARRLYEAACNRWTIRLSVVGNPIVFEGDTVLLDNFGPVVDGAWIVREVEHRIDNDGFTTNLGLKGKRSGVGSFRWPVPVYDPVTGRLISVYYIMPKGYKQDRKGHMAVDKAALKKAGKKDPMYRGQPGSTIGKRTGPVISAGARSGNTNRTPK